MTTTSGDQRDRTGDFLVPLSLVSPLWQGTTGTFVPFVPHVPVVSVAPLGMMPRKVYGVPAERCHTQTALPGLSRRPHPEPVDRSVPRWKSRVDGTGRTQYRFSHRTER